MNLTNFLERFIFIANHSVVVDIYNPHAAPLSYPDFTLAYANEIVEEVTLHGRIVQHALTKLWLNSPNRSTMHDFVYRPTNEWYENYAWIEGGVRYFNTFHMPAHTEPKEKPAIIESNKVALVLHHLGFLFDKSEEMRYFLGWLAHLVQFPGQRPKVVPLLIAPKHGTGRGWLVELINKLIGSYNCSVTTVDEMVERKWGNVYDGTLFTCVHECKVRAGRFAINDKIRDQLTEPRLAINKKYGSLEVNQAVFTRTLLMSNHLDAVVVPREDRRIWVAATYGYKQNEDKEAYYTALYNFLDDDENILHFYWYLRQLKIKDKDFMIEAPWTEAKQNVVESDQGEEDFILHDIMKEFVDNGIVVLHAAQLVDYAMNINASAILAPNITRARLGHMLNEHLIAYRGGIIKHKNQTIRPLFIATSSGHRIAAQSDKEDVRSMLAETDRIIASMLTSRHRKLHLVPKVEPLE